MVGETEYAAPESSHLLPSSLLCFALLCFALLCFALLCFAFSQSLPSLPSSLFSLSLFLSILALLVSYSWEDLVKKAFTYQKNSLLIEIKQGTQPEGLHSLYSKIREILDPQKSHNFSSISAVHNPCLSKLFLSSLELTSSKHTDTRSLFQKEDWKNREDTVDVRRKIVSFLGDYASKFREEGWNNGERVIFLPLFKSLFATFLFPLALISI